MQPFNVTIRLFSFAVPLVNISVVEGKPAELPCDITPPGEDSLHMVFWFKNEAGVPLYTWVIRSLLLLVRNKMVGELVNLRDRARLYRRMRRWNPCGVSTTDDLPLWLAAVTKNSWRLRNSRLARLVCSKRRRSDRPLFPITMPVHHDGCRYKPVRVIKRTSLLVPRSPLATRTPNSFLHSVLRTRPRASPVCELAAIMPPRNLHKGPLFPQ